MLFLKPFLVSVVLLISAIACSALGIAVYDESQTLKDGELLSLKLPEGVYRLEMTATGDGATVQWLGGNCPGVRRQTNTHEETCELTQAGQVVISNPSSLGLGASSVVTVVIHKE